MTTGRKLAVAAAAIVAVTAYMAYTGASASWQYYLTAEECLAQAASLGGDRLRVSGQVAPGTLRIEPDRRRVAFALQSRRGPLRVVCSGPPPDNLAEGMDVVVEGRLENGPLLRGDKLLTRCASKYQSRPPSSARRAAVPSTPPRGR